MTYQPTKWCDRCKGVPVTDTDLCPACQGSEARWQATARAAGETLSKYGFKPAPTPDEQDAAVLWDAMEGRR